MVAKQIADLITLTRGLLVFIFPWLALAQGPESLPWAVALLAADWTGDSLDGPLARRSRLSIQTWIGDHDLEFDMAVAAGLLAYMFITGYVQATVALVYAGIWGVYFLRVGIPRPMGMLFQAPIYGWFIYVALMQAPGAGWWLVAWVLAAVVVTWPKFPREVVPGFLNGMRETLGSE